MWFLIKGTFWFGLVLVALSYFSNSSSSPDATSPVKLAGAVSAASEAYNYVSSICVEKPDVCVKGAETFQALGERAREGARVAYEFLDTQLATKEAPQLAAPSKTIAENTAASHDTDQIMTGTVVPLPQKRPAL